MEKILDNTVRGNRTLFWMKITLVMAVVLCGVLLAMGHVMGGLPRNLDEATASQASSMLYLVLGLFFSIVLFLLSFVIQGCYWLSWMYRSVTNLKKLGPTKISPLLAVILSVIPYLGLIVHCFIFRYMAIRMETHLKELDVKYPQVSMGRVGAIGLLLLMSFIALRVNDGQVPMLISSLTSLAAFICYIMELSVYVRQEKLLLTAGQDEIFRRKVDEEIKRREAEKGFDHCGLCPEMDHTGQGKSKEIN